MNRPLLLPLLCLLATLTPLHATTPADPAAPLAASFKNPPASAKPWTWWHWVSGNVSKEGITADLEAMKNIGLGGVQLFTVDQSDVHGPVKFMSPEWRDLVKFAFSEAARLHLTMSMEGCDGWSETGGPWVAPAESMKKVVWTERTIDGGAIVPLDLPQPETILGYSADIALFAYPTLAESGTDLPVSITSSDPKFVPGDIATGGTSQINLSGGGNADWIQASFAAPVTIHSVQFRVSGSAGIATAAWTVESSTDGKAFGKISEIHPADSELPVAVTAQYFRLSSSPARASHANLSGLKFGGPILDQFTARSGMTVSIDANKFTQGGFMDGEMIDPQKLVNLTGQKTWAAPAGKWTIVRIAATSTGVTTHPSTTPGLEVDKLSAQAVSDHINSMFNPVFQDSPSAVGSTFKYILLDSWEAKCENWTPDMPAQFKARRGYDLTPWLLALTGKVIGSSDQTQRFLWDFRRTLADLVAEEHYKVIQDFAHQHHMGLASEATGIGIPTIADQLLCKKYTDIPMGEFWVNKSAEENIDDTKEAASAAHIYGMPIAGAESFTSRPQTAAWTNDPYSLKALGDQEFCLGINRFIFHRYAHQPWLDRVPGMTMGPWGINFERTNTWWQPGAAWITYITRCQSLLQQGRYVADLCYYYGESAPATLHHADLVPAPPQGYAYDVCNTDVLLNLMTVDDQGQIALPDGMRYRVLILPPTDRMTVAVLKKIAQLVDAGATVYGPKPTHSPSLADNDADVAKIADELWGSSNGQTKLGSGKAYGKGSVYIWGELAQVAKTGPDFSTDRGDFLFIHRLIGNADVYFISNQGQQETTVNCTFRIAGKLPELWHPDTGATETLAEWKSDGTSTTLPVHFDPSGSAFVVFRHPVGAIDAVASINPEPISQPTQSLAGIKFLVDKAGDYEVISINGAEDTARVPQLPPPIEVTGPWQLTFPPKLGAPATASFDKLISWTESPIDGIKYFSGTATYKNTITLPADFLAKDRRFYLDLGEVKNLARVIVNGQDLGVLWKPPFRTDITPALHKGANNLEIRVTNLWPNRLIGDQSLPVAQRITWTSVSLYKADSPLLPSGLLGPVKIIPAQSVTLNLPGR